MVSQQLRDLRRYAPVVIQNAQKINVGQPTETTYMDSRKSQRNLLLSPDQLRNILIIMFGGSNFLAVSDR
jgi:hypothetical protein